MQINPISLFIKYLVEDCYEEDYNIYDYENNNDIYCNNYTFIEWYFRYRKLWCLNKNKYTYTPAKLIIGWDILDSGYTYI